MLQIPTATLLAVTCFCAYATRLALTISRIKELQEWSAAPHISSSAVLSVALMQLRLNLVYTYNPMTMYLTRISLACSELEY